MSQGLPGYDDQASKRPSVSLPRIYYPKRPRQNYDFSPQVPPTALWATSESRG